MLGAERQAPPAVLDAPALLHVSVVYVDPAWRRRGIAKRMLESAFAWGRDRGCLTAKLHVLSASPARGLYESLGFAERQIELRRRL